MNELTWVTSYQRSAYQLIFGFRFGQAGVVPRNIIIFFYNAFNITNLESDNLFLGLGLLGLFLLSGYHNYDVQAGLGLYMNLLDVKLFTIAIRAQC